MRELFRLGEVRGNYWEGGENSSKAFIGLFGAIN
jgi:hypothetical protein